MMGQRVRPRCVIVLQVAMRPTILTVTCVLGIIWAGMKILAPLALIGHLVLIEGQGLVTVVTALQPSSPHCFYLVISMGLLVPLVLGCIDGLRLKPRGERLLRLYVRWTFIYIIAHLVIEYGYVLPFATPDLRGTMTGSSASNADTVTVLRWVTPAALSTVQLIMPALIWFTLRRPAVRDAFNGVYHRPVGFEVQARQK